MRSSIPVPADFLFDWHARNGAFERLSPPWEPVELRSKTGGIQDGARVELLMRVGPVRRKWIAEHRNYLAGRRFQDVQVEGPFAKWEHTHTILPEGTDACVLEDRIEFALPGGAVGRWWGGPLVRRKLERVFSYRHRTTIDDVLSHYRSRKAESMKILVSGATGLIGSALVPFLTTGGHEVSRLVRSSPENDRDVFWDPASDQIDKERLEGFDAVVHLAGETIANGRWNAQKKQRIRESRVRGTRLLAEALAGLSSPPKVLACASAIGYYGNRSNEVLDESSSPGSGFLAGVCEEWEAAADPARHKGIRVTHHRFGMVLSPEGGALAKMLTPFKMGVGGPIGSGSQYWSWIARDDAVGAIHHALMHEELSGPINCTAPDARTCKEFVTVLGRVLKRPTAFPMPAFAARLALGEMADELLLASAQVIPKRLTETGYQFRFPDLEDALRHLLGKSGGSESPVGTASSTASTE